MLEKLSVEFPDVTVYEDWREMLYQEGGELDITCVGTPDHMHAPMAMSAMRRGLHVYMQKPLAHDIFEVRRLTEYARRRKLVTQMGIQIHSRTEYLTAEDLIQNGAIGKIREVCSWSNKKWGDLEPFSEHTDPVPSTLNWNLWLGVAEPRPFMEDYYHPMEWRKRVDFGTATFGDMGCHIFDPVFSSLRLGAPLTIRSEGPAPNEHNWAINAVIHYVFPGTPFTVGETVDVHWYDGDKRPPEEVQALLGETELPSQGSIFIGEGGVMLLPHIGAPVLLPEAQFKDFVMPTIESVSHYHTFVDAALGNGSTSTGFDYSGPLTEAVLLGPLATHFPNTTLEWNAASMRFKNSREANFYVRRRYRKGWEVNNLSG